MKAIMTKILNRTETKPCRVKAFDSDKNQVTVPYDGNPFDDSAHRKAAVALCKKMGWPHENLVSGETNTGHVFCFPDPKKHVNGDLQFIDVIEPETKRVSSLGIGGNRNTGEITVTGGLAHNSRIEPRTRAAADLLISWLQLWKEGRA